MTEVKGMRYLVNFEYTVFYLDVLLHCLVDNQLIRKL